MSISTRIVLDLETLPTSQEWIKEEIRASIKPPGNIKKPESIEKWHKEHGEAAYLDKWKWTAVDTTLAEIFCIGFRIEGMSPECFWNKNEKELLEQFWSHLDNVTSRHGIEWVTFNGNKFDLPLLWHRSKLLKVPMTRHIHPFPKNGAYCFDVMEAWTGSYTKDRISLDKLAKLFGIKGKQGMTGADVYDYYLAERYSEIAAYCLNDVEVTGKLAELIA